MTANSTEGSEIDVRWNDIHQLVGKIVLGIFVAEGEGDMVIETDVGDMVLSAIGDCCSETWFADFLGVDALIHHVVLKVDDVPLENYDVEDGRGRQEYDRVYGYRFTTEAGYADLIFRNSSNGYYGGELAVGSRRPRENLHEITADWKA